VLEKVNEPVGVLASFGQNPRGGVKVTPHSIRWRGRKYTITTFGLYHPERRGSKRVHIFSFASGPTAFRLELDPDTLAWTLVEAYYDA
jgi:hypothetical protein